MNKRYAALIAGALLLAACQEEEVPPATEVVVTAAVTAESGEEVEVTRVVRQTIQVAVTPLVELPDPESSVVLDISFNGSYSGLDPQLIVEDNAVDVMENIYAGLTRFNPSANAIEPELATSWQTSENGRTWTFDLRDDIFWARPVEEGTALTGRQVSLQPIRPVTAGDVVYAIQRACDPRLPTPDIFVLFIVEGCQRVSSLTEVRQSDLDNISRRPTS